MELDMETFIDDMKSVDELKPLEFNSAGERYLYDILAEYASDDNKLSVGDIDFESFTADDLDAFRSLYDRQIVGGIERAERLFRLFWSTEPKSNAQPKIFF